MQLVGLALASVMALGPGDQAAADSIVVTPPAATPEAAPPPPAAPQPPPPSVDAWGPSADVAASAPANSRPLIPPRRPSVASRPPSRGIGLFIGGAVAFGIGLGARIDQADHAAGRCQRWRSEDFANVSDCFSFYDPTGVDTNDIFVGGAYGSGMVLTMVGAGALGRHAAWQSTFGDRGKRNPNSRYIAGAIMTGLGIASIAAHYALVYADGQNPCTSFECNVQRRALWIAASDGGAMMLNAGFGLFSWAGNYRSNLRKYRRMRLSVTPGVTQGSVGATVGMRF